ncbi:MAG: glycosyltransferase [Oscillospiraceae bacterium]|nr:glycosyltransferase [Oscillospiraceae bacterium]
MKTKVWQVIWGLKDGGAEVLAREYARLVNKQSFDTTIVTMYPFENTANYLRAKEAQIKVVSIFKKRNTVTRAVRVLFGKWYVPIVLKRMIKNDGPDVIHFNSPMAYCFTPLKKQLSGINLLYTCHSEVNKHFYDKEKKAVDELIRDNNLRLIALHEDMKKELNSFFSTEDTVVIRNGVELTRFRDKLSDRNITRKNINIAQNAYIIGHIGRFSKEKNHEFLLQVFKEIASRKQNAHLLLVGNGELKDQIVQRIEQMQIKDRVTILSHRTDIPELLHAMDVMVFPSFFEGLSVTLVEAQAAGLRCVISDTINPANYLSENTIPVSLEKDAAIWAEIALDSTVKNMDYGNIDDYDMNKEIRKLESLYYGKTDE